MGKKTGFQPSWTSAAPAKETYRSIFKWGAPDGFKHPNQRLFSMVKEKFGLTDGDFQAKEHEGNEKVRCHTPAALSRTQIEAFKAIVGEANVEDDDYSRVKYSTGKTMEEAMMLRRGELDGISDLVVHPRTKEDVRQIVSACNAQGIPVYVYGGGSSVNFGFRPSKGGISLVMSTHMNRVISLNETNQTVTVEPGIMGPVYESLLNNAPKAFNVRKRYTGGHFPQSFEYSTVGGWISALGSGQQSSYYGDACDLVLSQEYVTPAGSFKTLGYPATATGPKVNDMMKGSEGAFGVLVEATLKVFQYMPENQRRFAFIFPSWASAVDAAREISQGEFGMPSVFRISDPEETDVALKLYGVEGTVIDRVMALRGFKPKKRCLYIGQAEGEKGFAQNVKKKVKRICRQNGAMFISGYPVQTWEKGRYKDPYLREDLNDFGIIIDTLETGVTWDNLHRLHQGVRGFIKERPRTICMTHASHFYPQGTNLYLIFMLRMNDVREYKAFQDGVIDRIQQYGGSLSHHHGVGKMLSPWMENHLGKTQMDILRAVKRHLDPNNIMNPGGTLGLDV